MPVAIPIQDILQCMVMLEALQAYQTRTWDRLSVYEQEALRDSIASTKRLLREMTDEAIGVRNESAGII